MVLIGFITYIFALIFVQAVTEHLIVSAEDFSESEVDVISQRLGSVAKGVLTVYEMLTGGRDWGEIYPLLERSGFIAGPACLAMVAFFTISVWNIITSVFIEKAMDLAQPSIREQVVKRKKQFKIDAQEVEEMITAQDKDNTGSISREEFKRLCGDQSFREFLMIRELNIDTISDLDTFFDMVSYRDTATLHDGPCDEISISCVVDAFLQMKGTSTNLDMHRLQYEMHSTQCIILGMQQALLRDPKIKQLVNGSRTDFNV
jgi:hypothetical protein